MMTLTKFGASPADVPVERPEHCPFCRSRAVGTLAKVITAQTYWRCQACAEGWTAALLAMRRPLAR